MADATSEYGGLYALINQHVGPTFKSFQTDLFPDRRIRLFVFDSDVSVIVDGTALPAGRYAMWYPEDEIPDDNVLDVAGFQMCATSTDGVEGIDQTALEDFKEFSFMFLFGREREGMPPAPIRFSEYLFEVMRAVSDEPEDRIRAALEKLEMTLSQGVESEPALDNDQTPMVGQAGGQKPTIDIPQVDTMAIRNHVVPNSKPTHTLRDGNGILLFKEGGRKLAVDKKQTKLVFELSNEDPEVRTSEEITALDVAIIEAITTLRCAGNSVVSPDQVLEAVGIENPTREQREECHAEVLRLQRIVGRIDWSEQAKRWKVLNPETGKPFVHAEIVGSLLNVTVFDGEDTDGNRYIRYQINSDPITYQHAQLVGQVVEYPQSLLALSPIDGTGKTRKRVTTEQKKLVRAVLWYVYSLKNPKNKMNDTIGYDALFNFDGYRPNSNSARKRAITFVHDYLRALQNEGVIAGFEPIETGKEGKLTQVKIVVEKPRRRLR